MSDIAAKLKKLDLKGPRTDNAPDDLDPVFVPLDWVDWSTPPKDSRMPGFLAKLCKYKPKIDLLCSVCKDNGELRCGAYGARYCSKNCQDSDWKRHKKVCKTFAEWDYSARPSEDHYLAMFLPTDKTNSELVWYRFPSGAAELLVTHPDVHRLEYREPVGRCTQINTSIVLERRMWVGHGIALLDIYGLTDMEEDGLLNINKSITSLASAGSMAFYAGPHMIIAFEGNKDGPPDKGMDVSQRDWSYMMDYLVLNPKNPSIHVLPDYLPAQFSTRINDLRSILVSDIHHINEPVESAIAPVSHWSLSGPCSLAFQIGLPWKTRCVLGSELASVPVQMRYLSIYLRRQPRPGDDDDAVDWVTASNYKCGSIIITSTATMRIVHKHHVKAFIKYLDYSRKNRIVPSKDGFMAYWDNYAAVTSNFEDMHFIPHPYHLLPRRQDLVAVPGESDDHRDAVMNLLGHFSARGYKMEMVTKQDVFLPVDVVAPYDTEGRFQFTDEERSVPSGSYAPFGSAIAGTREEEAGRGKGKDAGGEGSSSVPGV